MKKRIAAYALGAMIAIFGQDSAARAETGVTKDAITIGGMGALTGPFQSNILSHLHGVQLVFEEANAAGGINGRKIKYVLEDDECLPEKAVGAVKKIIYDSEPLLIVGGGCSNASIAQKPEIIAAKIPWIIVASSADSLTEPVNPYIFTTMSAAWMEVYAQLQFLIDQGKKRIAVVWQPDAWGKARIDPLKVALSTKGITPVAIEEIPVEPTDVTATALKLKAANPDAVLMLLFPKAAIPYLRDAYKVGLTPVSIGGSPLQEIDILAKGVGNPAAIANFRAITPNGFGADDPEVAQWKTKIETRFPNDRFSGFHMTGLHAGQFVVEALKKAGPDLTREKLLAVISNLTYQSDLDRGPMKCTPEDHQCFRTLGVFALKDGRNTAVGAATPVR